MRVCWINLWIIMRQSYGTFLMHLIWYIFQYSVVLTCLEYFLVIIKNISRFNSIHDSENRYYDHDSTTMISGVDQFLTIVTWPTCVWCLKRPPGLYGLLLRCHHALLAACILTITETQNTSRGSHTNCKLAKYGTTVVQNTSTLFLWKVAAHSRGCCTQALLKGMILPLSRAKSTCRQIIVPLHNDLSLHCSRKVYKGFPSSQTTKLNPLHNIFKDISTSYLHSH